MTESKYEINQRKIRNGLRKQAEVIQREKEKIWDKLSTVDKKINIEVIKQRVNAKSRKLQAKWTMGKFDMPVAVSDDLVDEITKKLDAEILKELTKNVRD